MHSRISIVVVTACSALLGSFGFAQNTTTCLNRSVDLAQSDDYVSAARTALECLSSLPRVDQVKAHKVIGFAFRKLDELPAAWYHLSRHMELSGKDDAVVRDWLRELETLLRSTHVKVTLNCRPSGATVDIQASREEALVTTVECPAAWWFVPGRHTLVFSKAGYADRKFSFEVKEVGDPGIRDISLATIDIDDKTRSFSRWPEWTLVASGIVVAATGAVLHTVSHLRNEDLHDKYWNRANFPNAVEARGMYNAAYDSDVAPLSTSGYVLYAVGGAAVLTGVVTWALRRPPSTGKTSAGWWLMPWHLPQGGGASLTLDW